MLNQILPVRFAQRNDQRLSVLTWYTQGYFVVRKKVNGFQSYYLLFIDLAELAFRQ